MSNPLKDDPNAALAAALAGEGDGKLLAVYASIRSTTRVAEPLIGLGLPLIDYVLASIYETPVSVTATRGRHSAQSPLLGLGTDVELWTLLVRCASELTVTVDVAAGPWSTVAGPLELRVEWLRSGRVTTFHPRGATISSGDGSAVSLGLTGLEERLLDYAVDLSEMSGDGDAPAEFAGAMRIVEAARGAVSTGLSVDLDGVRAV